MKKAVFIFFPALLCMLCKTECSFGQESTFNQHDLWNPLFYTSNGNEYRSGTGAPGPKYWQNHADYKLDCTLDTVAKTIDGTVEITYRNNSPIDLPFLWLQVEENIYRADSRASQIYGAGGRFGVRDTTQGYEIKSVAVIQDGKSSDADYLITDTRMQIRLKNALKAGGNILKIRIAYSFYLPQYGEDRNGRLPTKNGWIYEVAQWYPRMEVFDDVEGWNSIPYLGPSEFYLEYGDLDATIHTPGDMIVVSSGQLLNPQEVLTSKEISRLNRAKNSDSTVMIRSEEEVTDPSSRPFKGNLAWHFRINNARDMAWAASTAFIWDAARINLPSGKKALAQSVYPVESVGPTAWTRSTEFVKGAIELYSTQWYEFEYPVATDVAGTVGGMEYPGIVFCSYRSRGSGLWGVVNHEFGHNWFPMTVGSNERKFAWMDEGFNTFINGVDTKVFNHGEFDQPRDVEAAALSTFGPQTEAIMNTQDVLQGSNNGTAAYSKPAMALNELRDNVLGHDRFDYAFRTYIKWWAFKHPTPVDFFRTMENASGEDLDWFWKEWFYKNYSLDQGVTDVHYTNNDPTQGSMITIENFDRMAMPVLARITEKNGQVHNIKLPVEIWQRGPVFTFPFSSTSEISKVELDPDHVLPDMNPDNNTWELIVKKPIPSGVTATTVINRYLSAIGGEDKLRTVKDLSIEAESGTNFNFNEEWKAPDKYKLTVFGSGANRNAETIVVNGNKARMDITGGRTRSLQGPQKDVFLREAAPFPELHYADSGYRLTLMGLETQEGKDLYILQVTFPDSTVSTEYYDADSGLKVREESIRKIRGNTVRQHMSFGDYRNVGGILFPYTRTTSLLNRPEELQVKSIKVDTEIADSDFQ
jgi:hypothetical protein